MPVKEKDPSIETLRGLAIILVVAGYVIRTDLARGVHASVAASALRFLYDCLTPIRMPLFAMISGYLYARAPVQFSSYSKFLSGKARRLLLPFAFVSLLQFGIFSGFSDNPFILSSVLGLLLFPFAQFWFLTATFLIAMLTGLLDCANLLGTKARWMGFLALALCIHVGADVHTKFLSIHGINLLLPYFLLGYGMRRYIMTPYSDKTLKILKIVFAAAFLLEALAHARNLPLGAQGYRLLGACMALSGLPLLMHWKREIPALAHLGTFAFSIYLFYVFGASIGSSLADYLRIRGALGILLIELAAGLGFPILAHLALERNSLTRSIFLGLRRPISDWKSVTKVLWRGLGHPLQAFRAL